MPPLSVIRTLLGTPTKKGKFTEFSVPEGTILARGALGQVLYRANADRVERIRTAGEDAVTVLLEPATIEESCALDASAIVAAQPEAQPVRPIHTVGPGGA